MSRGPGRWQRALLAALSEYRLVPVVDLVWVTLGRSPTRAELVAARRAAKTLVLSGQAFAFLGRICQGCRAVHGRRARVCCSAAGFDSALVLTRDAEIARLTPPALLPSWISVAPQPGRPGATLSGGSV